MKKEYKPATEKQKAGSQKSLPKANQAIREKAQEKKERAVDAQKRTLGKDPEHPIVGSQAHFDKHGW